MSTLMHFQSPSSSSVDLRAWVLKSFFGHTYTSFCVWHVVGSTGPVGSTTILAVTDSKLRKTQWCCIFGHERRLQGHHSEFSSHVQLLLADSV